jgi:hypothetical protein
MEKMVIKKSVDIHASKEKIWNVLMDDHYSRQKRRIQRRR